VPCTVRPGPIDIPSACYISGRSLIFLIC